MLPGTRLSVAGEAFSVNSLFVGGGGEGGGGNECKQTHPDILLLMAAGYSPSVTIDTPFGAVCP